MYNSWIKGNNYKHIHILNIKFFCLYNYYIGVFVVNLNLKPHKPLLKSVNLLNYVYINMINFYRNYLNCPENIILSEIRK